MGKDYTREAQMAAEAYVKAHPHFHGPTYSLEGDVNFSLDEAAKLIALSKIERQHILQTIANQEQSQEVLAQARENVSLLPDAAAERIQREWIESAAAQAKKYSDARNRNSQPRSTLGTDPSITDGVISWIESKRKKNWFKSSPANGKK